MKTQHATSRTRAQHTHGRHAGRNNAATLNAGQLAIHDPEGSVDPELMDWVQQRIERMQARYATQARVDRIEVDFGDVNKARGHADRSCSVTVVLNRLTPIAIEMRADSERAAFDMAADRAQFEVTDALNKLGIGVKSSGRRRGIHKLEGTTLARGMSLEAPQSLFDRRVGHGTEQLRSVQARPEKERRDAVIDTSLRHTGADMRTAGGGHTAKRNTKLQTAGMVYRLEDSTSSRPSRKSTRGGKNRIKPAAGLTTRTKSAVHKPSERAARGR